MRTTDSLDRGRGMAHGVTQLHAAGPAGAKKNFAFLLNDIRVL